MDACIAATRAAVSAAVAGLTGGEAWPPFEAVWAAYAGCGRASDRALLQPHLAALFPGASLRLTGDGDLLCAPLAGVGAALVCGTGSLAQLWRVSAAGEPVRLLRSGGWGPVLDDRGSGLALGKAGVCSVLHYAANGLPAPAWHAQLLAQIGTDAEGLVRATSALDTALPHADADARRKTAIAGLSGVVVRAAREGDAEARRLLRRVAQEVCEVLEPIWEKLGEPGAEAAEIDAGASQQSSKGEDSEGDGAKPTLVVAGGLGLDPTFWACVEAQFAARGWAWRVVGVDDPARAGLEHLLRTASA